MPVAASNSTIPAEKFPPMTVIRWRSKSGYLHLVWIYQCSDCGNAVFNRYNHYNSFHKGS